VQLVALFEGQLRFDESTEVAFASHAEDGDWFSYVMGDGEVTGERLSGKVTWTNHPRRRADGTWLPDFTGVIVTDDGVEILFFFHGYNQGVAGPEDYDHRTAVAALTLVAGDDRYRWVNDVFAILEADVKPSANPEVWQISAYECVNDVGSR
jgi:hypothetical protein